MDVRILNILSANHDTLISLYQEHLEAVRALQTILLERILPNVVDELGLDEEATEQAIEWLEDVPSIFRMLKRHKFTTSFALESMRMTLVWRLTELPFTLPTISSDFIYCLPPVSRDAFGRPILVLRLAALNAIMDDPRADFLRVVELLRLHLKGLNLGHEDRHQYPLLQYTLLLDMANVSMRSINVDLLTWYTREVVPRFPGLLAAVFMINFSWTHSGMWNLLKHVLPESALSKVFFPSLQTLHHIIPPSSLPQEYGGLLPSIEELPNLIHIRAVSPPPGAENTGVPYSPTKQASPRSPRATHFQTQKASALSPTSRLNPFFGYPVGPSLFPSSSSLPYLRHGRQRKRDLFRTLAVLWWEKWGTRASVAFALCLSLYLVELWRRRRRLPWVFSVPRALSILRTRKTSD